MEDSCSRDVGDTLLSFSSTIDGGSSWKLEDVVWMSETERQKHRKTKANCAAQTKVQYCSKGGSETVMQNRKSKTVPQNSKVNIEM